MACHWKGSKPRRQLPPQMSTEREVSMVDHWAAEAIFVVVTPHTLKKAIEIIIPIV